MITTRRIANCLLAGAVLGAPGCSDVRLRHEVGGLVVAKTGVACRLRTDRIAHEADTCF